jgi:N-hydroxyarylamine O-acetyltransferase
MNIDAYLERIGYAGPLEPSAETLAALQRAHMLTVPFENLDIGRGRRLVLDREPIFDKVVGRRRGGWCFELNQLFAALLVELGFTVTLLGSKVIDPEGGESEDLVHLIPLVDLDPPLIADVGFGESSLMPIPLDPSGEIRNGGLRVRYTLEPRRIEDFAHQSARLQTWPDSHFVKNRICTLALPDGRITLSDLRLIETRNGRRTERALSGEAEWARVLRDRFGIVLD